MRANDSTQHVRWVRAVILGSMYVVIYKDGPSMHHAGQATMQMLVSALMQVREANYGPTNQCMYVCMCMWRMKTLPYRIAWCGQTPLAAMTVPCLLFSHYVCTCLEKKDVQ